MRYDDAGPVHILTFDSIRRRMQEFNTSQDQDLARILDPLEPNQNTNTF
jgi:hypothetical protein